MNNPATLFNPLSDDTRRNSPQCNDVIDKLLTRQIKILRLFRCEDSLFQQIAYEVKSLASSFEGQVLDQDHPTTKYVQSHDPNWTMKPKSLHQYSLYNSRDDVLFNDEDHHWHESERSFNSALPALKSFFSRYFGNTELQNFRLQTIQGTAEIGKHREKLIGIPKRTHHFKIRFHLPIVTNSSVQFEMDTVKFQMTAGNVYLFNQACLHNVINDGKRVRSHLIFDCYLNSHVIEQLIRPNLEGH